LRTSIAANQRESRRSTPMTRPEMEGRRRGLHALPGQQRDQAEKQQRADAAADPFQQRRLAIAL
jgi:hypothetical protein